MAGRDLKTGFGGRKHSEDWKEERRQYMKKRWVEDEEFRKSITEKSRDRKHSDATKLKMSFNHADISGENNPMCKPEAVEKVKQAALERWADSEFKAAMGKITETRWQDPEFRKRMEEIQNSFEYREAMKNASTEYWSDPENRAYQGRVFDRLWKEPKFRELQSKASKERMEQRWAEPEKREEMLKAILEGRHIKPNKAELRLFSILQKHFPGDYALNVQAEVMTLGGKIPDFVNVNGQKKIIELYGDYFHQEEKLENGGDGGKERKEIFAKCGFETLIVWEHELLNEDLLVQRLTKFKYVRKKKSHC